MPRRRARSVLSRLLVAAFALWLPAATGQGGKATCIAAASYAKALSERPHLSCHGEKGAKKRCCCNSEPTIRAAACGCHDGQTMHPTAAHDPTIASGIVLAGVRPAVPYEGPPPRLAPFGRLADAPDPPPPRSFVFDRA